MKAFIMLVLLAVLCFGQPAVVWSFAVQPHQMEEELNEAFSTESMMEQAEKQGAAMKHEQRRAPIQEAMTEEETVVEAASEEGLSGAKKFFILVGGLVAAMGVGAKFIL